MTTVDERRTPPDQRGHPLLGITTMVFPRTHRAGIVAGRMRALARCEPMTATPASESLCWWRETRTATAQPSGAIS